MPAATTVLDAIGQTPMVALRRVVPAAGARVFLKLESHNPTGSMKDRMARAVVESARASGRLSPTGRVIEYTGGSTGTSLAFVCAALGVPLTVVTSDAFSREKRDHMRALGATVIEVPSDGGKTTRELIQRMIATAQDLARAPDVFYADQFNNLDAAGGYGPMAREILQQLDGPLDAFVQSVGTAQCILGVEQVLRAESPSTRIVAVEPAESPVLSGGAPGSHKIEGVGPGFVAPRWRPDLADEILTVSTAEAREMTRRLAREEGVFAGTSTGANVVAALRVAERLDAGQMVVTIACDTGLKYLTTDVYAQPG